MLDALDPRSSKGTASALPSALLAELEEIQSIGGPTHIQGVGRRSVSFTGGPTVHTHTRGEYARLLSGRFNPLGDPHTYKGWVAGVFHSLEGTQSTRIQGTNMHAR